VGVALSVPLLHGLDRLSRSADDAALLSLEWPVVLAGFGLALLAGLLAGIYPAWRICRIAPALHLKQA
jgi:putative ABC transport system permease protein